MNNDRHFYYGAKRQTMPRVVVLTDYDTGLGFQLAGVEVFKAKSSAEAESSLCNLMLDKDIGIIALNEDFLEGFSERIKKRLEGSKHPIVFPFPSIKKWEETAPPEEYVARLIRRAIGYHLKIRR
ncbi:MAG: V-type ATP synthase subunit F [Nitrospirae bacterium]|nr:V-type ATP synthase subunit F [Nitrospirota bacterium]